MPRSHELRPMMRLFRAVFMFAVLLTLPLVAHAQDGDGGGNSAGISRKQQERNLAKKERKDKKSLAKEEKRIYKLHREHQDKATRKRMKRNERRANKHGQNGHRDPFLRRLFGSRH